MRSRTQLLTIAVASALQTSAFAVPIWGTPEGASAELSVGRSAYWFSITNLGDSVASLSTASAAPVQFGPGGDSAFPLPPGTSATASGLLADGTRFGRLGGTLNGTPVGTRLAIWPVGASAPILAQSLGQATNGSAIALPVSHNAAGVVAGYATRYESGVAVGSFRPVIWSREGVITELGTLATSGSSLDTRAQRISANGHIAGFERGGSGSDFRPIRWLPGSTQAIELETFAPLTTSQSRRGDVYGVNDVGTVVGSSRFFANTTTFGVDRAVRWENGGAAMTVLDGLSVSSSSTAYGLNASGDIVGSATTDQNTTRAVLWPAGKTAPLVLDSLSILPANSAGDRAYAVNRLRSVVGTTALWNDNSFGGTRAALWTNGSTSLLDLNTLLPTNSGWTLQEAGAITDTGFVRGTGKFDPDGNGGVVAYNRSWTLLVPSAGTYGRGDANFDTHINFDDLLILAQHYGESNPTQDVHVGDFDLSGHVNFDDLLALAQHHEGAPTLVDTGAFGSSIAADWALAQSLVPEPALAGCLALIPRRRRRR